MSAVAAAVLESVGEGRIALESVSIDCSLRGLLSETVVTQTYQNAESVNIEAVYTFPLAADAVLLALEVTLNGETLHSQVQLREQASTSYEDAIDDGNSALLLESLGAGLYTLNIGNLMAGERAVVRLRYAQLHHFHDDTLRVLLPTTIAPRYGDPAAAGLAPHQVPETALGHNPAFCLCVSLHGPHAQAYWHCPSHKVSVESSADALQLRVEAGSASMDRDFVLILCEQRGTALPGSWRQDTNGIVALASFHPQRLVDAAERPRKLTLLVDCSGSMAGDSIAQARDALQDILGLLRPQDRFNLVAFGSGHLALFSEPVLATPQQITKAMLFVEHLDADMGGTEIGSALRAASGSGDVLLITDGDVWQAEDIIRDTRRSGTRVFTVGVGSAVSEAFVRDLAHASDGACELVAPNEAITDHIVRQFCRMNQSRVRTLEVRWPAEQRGPKPAVMGAVFAGDTVHAFGHFDSPPNGTATLLMTLEDGHQLRSEVIFGNGCESTAIEDLPRIAAHTRLADLAEDEAAMLAVEYQLVTPSTGCVMVHTRQPEEQARRIPALRKVPQQPAAGFGGFGDIPCFFRRTDSDSQLDSPTPDIAAVDLLDVPGFLQHVPDDIDTESPGLTDTEASSPPKVPSLRGGDAAMGGLAESLNRRYSATGNDQFTELNLEWLAALGLEQDYIERLADVLGCDASEADIVRAVLCRLRLLHADSTRSSSDLLSRHVTRLIRRELKAHPAKQDLVELVTLEIG